MSHTPTPWEIKGNGKQVYGSQDIVANCDYQQANDDDEEGLEADDALARENARHIVRCVNSHDALVEACKAALEELEDFPQDRVRIKQIEAALAAAEGGKA